jgi:uncharacterized protein (DUF1800 family)
LFSCIIHYFYDKRTFMDRREFLTAGNQKQLNNNQSAVIESPGVLSGIQPYSGPWTSTEVLHLLRRTLFGVKKSNVDFFSAMSMSQAVDYLLTVPSAQPDPPLKTYANSATPGDPDAAIPAGSTWVNINTTDGGINSQRRQSLKNWWMGLMINQDRNIREKMVLFWHNHFATEMNDISNGIWCYKNNLLLRTHALGNLKSFVRAVTLDPAMLRYLNGYVNTKTAPDENYGRELQELFTVGKGIDNATPPYSEDDVKAAARVLTGWSVNNDTNSPVFNLSKHDTNNKQFSSYFNNSIITGRNASDAGLLELDDLLNVIFASPDVAANVCRRLYRWFVYYEIDASAEANVIQPLAAVFRNNNYDILPLISALLKSEHFYDALNQGCMIKSPLHGVAGLCREFGIVFPAPSDITGNYYMWQYLQGIAKGQQQDLGDPPSVAGWQAYYQAPQYSELWINSDTLPKRNQFNDLMNANGYTRSGKTIKIDHTIFAGSMPDPGNPSKLIEDSIKYLLPLPLTQTSRDQLKKDILLGGQENDSYWTTVWNTYKNNPGDTANTSILKTRLASLYQYLLRLAEYQLS